MNNLYIWLLLSVTLGVVASCASYPGVTTAKNLKVDLTIGENCAISVEPKTSRCETGITSVCGLPGDTIDWKLSSKSLAGADFRIEIADEAICDELGAKKCRLKDGLPPGETKYDIIGEGTTAACREDPYIIVLR